MSERMVCKSVCGHGWAGVRGLLGLNPCGTWSQLHAERPSPGMRVLVGSGMRGWMLCCGCWSAPSLLPRGGLDLFGFWAPGAPGLCFQLVPVTPPPLPVLP